MVARNYSHARPMLERLAGPLGVFSLLLATLLLLGLQGAATADQSNYQAQQQDQSAPGGVPAAAAQAAEAAAAALTESLVASASSNNYQSAELQQQQQQQQHRAGQQAGKSKKIQIVYIKVPLAKLRPSLANGHQGASNSSAGSDYSETSSPTNLLGSSSTNSNYGQAAYPQQQQARGPLAQSDGNPGKQHGGNSGTNGAGAYSSGTGSSTSYGANGPGPHASSSSAMASPTSSHAFDASAHSSGYGSGTSTSGVSAALSDYPAAQSTSSPYNHQSSQQAGRAPLPAASQTSGGAEEMQLKQAKKTIIPIVVQVEHALLGSNNEPAAYKQQQQRPQGANRYSGNRSNRQLGGKRGRQNGGANKNVSNQLYGLATNEIAQYGDIPPGAQWINAANSYDISQITAQINAENAASAAAALAQADAAFAQGAAGYSPPSAGSMQHQQAARPMQHAGRPGANQGASNAYAAGLQSAASALLANTHPMIQAAASGGLASVSKLGAKLGEMIALPSMQMPGSMASIGQSFPSALSSLTDQMGVQLGQAVQQVAKDHPTATAFARQVAQQAGIQLPNYGQQQHQQQQQANHHQHPQQQQHLSAASSQHVGQVQGSQSQLQNLKLGIGHSLQTAASSLIGLNQKANSASSLLPQSPSSALNQVALTAALKQLSAISPTAAQLAGQLAGLQSAASSQQQTVVAPPQSGSISEQESSASALQPNQQQLSILNQFLQQQQQVYRQLANLQQASGEANLDSTSQLEPAAKPAKASSGFKSKFLSFFQAPKFITNLIGWNDRADARNDQGEPIELAANMTTTSLAPNATSQTASSPTPTTESRTTVSAASTGASSTTSGQQTNATSAAASSTTANATSSTAKMPDTTRASTASSPAPTTIKATSAPPKSATSSN